MPAQIFKNRVIATAGPLPGQFTVDNLKQWTKLRKGRFKESLEDDVTHLLCTQEQFDKRVPIIKQALKHRKDVYILHFDWFEFSTVANKKLPEAEYSMRAALAQKNAERREMARIEKGKREGERGVNTTLFHVYHDEEYFPYQIDIRRDDSEVGDFGQRHTLPLWESNARPHLYWFTSKFLRKKGDSQPNFYRPSPCSNIFSLEMGHFRHFFRVKTGLEWQDRVLKEGTQPATGLRFSYDYCVRINEQLRAKTQSALEQGSETDSAGQQCVDDAARPGEAAKPDVPCSREMTAAEDCTSGTSPHNEDSGYGSSLEEASHASTTSAVKMDKKHSSTENHAS